MQPFSGTRILASYPSAFLTPRVKIPRYFIDYADGQVSLQDEEGQCYRNLKAARDVAIAALTDIGQEPPPDDGQRTFTAYVRDEAGTILCAMNLSLNAQCCSER